jgi:selenocysteine lyase/cysteine desulfurase
MIPCQRHLFDIPDDVAYLNCAYMSPLMKPALEAGTAGLARKAHPWELTPDKFFAGSDEFRTTAAQLLNCSADCIAIVPSASYGIATAARNLPVKKGQSILVLAEQFPSNYYPWQRLAEETGASLKIVVWPEDHDWTAAVLNSLTDDVAIAALPHVQWTSGGRLDLVRIGEACRKIGAALVLDLTQSLGALPFSVRDVQPDFAVAASYKWLGPIPSGFSMSLQNGRAEYRWKRIGFSAPTLAISPASSSTRKITTRARGVSTWASAPISRCCLPRCAL